MAGLDPFVAEIAIFPFNFAPKGWASCDGQLLPISQNTALFSLLGTTYGGDGKSSFALPNMEGRAPMHPEQGQGLSLHDLGEIGGTEAVTLLPSEIPSHSHTLSNLSYATATEANTARPAKSYWAAVPQKNLYSTESFVGQDVKFQVVDDVIGHDMPHNNMQPYLTLSFCIALQGVFPQRP